MLYLYNFHFPRVYPGSLVFSSVVQWRAVSPTNRPRAAHTPATDLQQTSAWLEDVLLLHPRAAGQWGPGVQWHLLILLLFKYRNRNSERRLQEPSDITDGSRLFKHSFSFGIGWSLNASAGSRLIQLPEEQREPSSSPVSSLGKTVLATYFQGRFALCWAQQTSILNTGTGPVPSFALGEQVGRAALPTQPEQTDGLRWTITENVAKTLAS